MDNAKLKPFAQEARSTLMTQVAVALDKVLNNDDIETRVYAIQIAKLKSALNTTTKEEIIERIAYTWFNRFVALRYMDLNNLNRIRIVSPATGSTQPELLSEAKSGNIAFGNEAQRQEVAALLNRTKPSTDPDTDAYRILFIAACNSLNKQLPFMFEKIDDYAEILLPHDLLSENSVLSKVIETLDAETCENVEVIGWLYQYYISAKKDKVFEDIKKKKIKVTSENIPAVTQLFTPHWIVKYLVENSLGRLWMLNNPTSNLVTKMEYYIKPESAETEFLKISSPEEIKICDPACGSGHMLTYAFDLLYEIYAERGYENSQIPSLILKNNLFGIEIDDRAGPLASFALSMKACEKDRRFLGRENKPMPNICVLQNILFHEGELKQYMDELGANLFTNNIKDTLHDFREAKNFGSLIRPHTNDVAFALNELSQKDLAGNLLLHGTNQLVLQALKQADYLSPKYHVVIANPPYMGGSNMNPRMAEFLKEHYTDVKSDLFSAFIVRNTEMCKPMGQLGFMTPFVWMFISSYEKLRLFLIEQKTISSLIQLEYSGFDGATVPICTFTIENRKNPNFKGGYIKLSDFRGHQNQAPKTLEAIKNPNCGWFYRASSSDFNKIPGSPIAYWVSERFKECFSNGIRLSEVAVPRKGFSTGNNDKFLRQWYETAISNVELCGRIDSVSRKTWFPCNKGGEFRKWYGNNFIIVNWRDNGRELKNFSGFVLRNPSYYFREGLTWSSISSSKLSMRYSPNGFLFEAKGPVCFSCSDIDIQYPLAVMNCKVVYSLLKSIAPTLDFSEGPVGKIPIVFNNENIVLKNTKSLISIAKSDWDSFETSWDFTSLPLLSTQYRGETLEVTYQNIRAFWQNQTDEMQRLEIENNRIFIDAYGLNDELTPDVPLKEITINCNPYYRYSDGETATLEGKLLFDTIQEFIHYAVGNMFGRYSLEKDGLILANQGEGLDDFLKQIPEPKYMPDEDNVLPIFGEGFKNWFSDDIATRFNEFLRISFGDEKFTENLAFIENTLSDNKKGKNISEYFQKHFYDYHKKRFKKRPIYWQFESPKGAFKALIYMHRYKPDQVSVILNDYLREFNNKITHQIESNRSILVDGNDVEKIKAQKEIDRLNPILREITDWERDIIFPLAQARIEIDLDDGVKVNYPKFGKALTKIVGLDASE